MKSLKRHFIIKIMIIQYFSDLHLEFGSKYDIQPIGEVLILAGDIGCPFEENYFTFLQEVSLLFPKIFLITGNHEYYGSTIETTNQKIEEIVSCFTNITFLNNSIEVYNGYTFVGTTLWSNLSDIRYLTCDRKRIKNITINEINELHNNSINFLQNTIENYTNVIVITHFLPSYLLTDKSCDSRYDQCYASSLDFLIKEPVTHWFYGHTHKKNNTIINNVNLLCNPIGYPNENENINFNENIII